MTDRSILPLYSGGNPSFPLTESPYNSRVEEQELIISGGTDFTDKSKNYQFVNFRPGFPLQASELNEIQEHFQLQMTLSVSMMHNWVCSGPGPVWWGRNESSPYFGDGSDVPPGQSGNLAGGSIPESGIGIGGGPNGTGHIKSKAVSGPAWKGSCPLHPFNSPYGAAQYNMGRPVQVSFNNTFGTLKITFNPGWWLVELPYNPPDVSYVSGLKHWIFLDHATDFTADPNYEVNIPSSALSGSDNIAVGLKLESSNYVCCNDPDALCDSDLGDNSAGFANDVACGASRYQINPISADWGVEPSIYNQLSLICKIDPAERTVRYINNLIIFSW